MDEVYDLAVAIAENSCCLFLGTGFSKHLSKDRAPGWEELLIQCANHLTNPLNTINTLFPSAVNSSNLPLDECAQIIEIQLEKEDKNLKTIISSIIQTLSCDQDSIIKTKEFFDKFDKLQIITTNYDDLLERGIFKESCISIFPGNPIAHFGDKTVIYHPHGFIKEPASLVVTSADYFDFINQDNYFSQKISTLMMENSILIIGYSLSDSNLKMILNQTKSRKIKTTERHNIFFHSRKAVPTLIKDFYESMYGIIIIDNIIVDNLLDKIIIVSDQAKKDIHTARKNLDLVLNKGHRYTDAYIQSRNSFFHIVSAASSVGIKLTSAEFCALIKKIIEQKMTFSRRDDAWDQYEHITEWVIYIGSIIDVEVTGFKDVFLEAVAHSMLWMAPPYTRGYSWASYKHWSNRWNRLTVKNRRLIHDHIRTHERLKDDQYALEISNEI